MKLIPLLFFVSFLAFGQSSDAVLRPRSFDTAKGLATFVDFKTAEYEINYDISKGTSSVKASIVFESFEEGLPVFDSVETPVSLTLDGSLVQSALVKTPSKETTLRIINKKTSVGMHKLSVVVPLNNLVIFQDGGVRSAFWTSDLRERNFLERYMPANLEYDQVKMTFLVNFIGSSTKQKIYTNGSLSKIAKSGQTIYKITFPKYFNASSIYFHTVPEGSTDELSFTLKSIDGREIPAVVYLTRSIWGRGQKNLLQNLKNKASEVFHELESDYGAWPHSSLVIYNAGAGGMEYCGATMTDVASLGHELFHSYFARGFMPANGNSGWLDEALASWRDDGYQTLSTLIGSTGMSSHPYYTRTTDTAAYGFGKRFMAYMDGKLKSKGGLKPFLRYVIDEKKFSPMFVEEFIKLMGSFYGVSVEADFKKYTYRKSHLTPINKLDNKDIHRKMTLSELKNYL